jgi:hypothetical protein
MRAPIGRLSRIPACPPNDFEPQALVAIRGSPGPTLINQNRQKSLLIIVRCSNVRRMSERFLPPQVDDLVQGDRLSHSLQDFAQQIQDAARDLEEWRTPWQ